MGQNLKGVYLPIVTPFQNGQIDYQSYENLIHHYISKGINGLIPLGTTGESPVIQETEFLKIVEKTVETVANRIPVYVGVGGNDTRAVIKKIKALEEFSIQGILSVCPYYNRPSQAGLEAHFLSIAETTPLDIIVYNIPYRTGVNLENDTLFKLSEQKNIAGVKDSCGNIQQTLDLLARKPANFSILTGEDILFFTTMANGGDGGILASAHLHTEKFVKIAELAQQNDFQSGLQEWRHIVKIIPYLFKEPNPSPIKFCLAHQQLIASDEVRLPLTTISSELKETLIRLLD
ncbi:MAG: 4-hydroxy-tetrahydrodipicolinate synthase [Desulfobacterales bacterium]